MYASTSARRASASIRRAPSRTISSITDDAADRAAPEPSRSAESETTVSIGSYLPDQRCRAGLAWNLSSVTREGTPHPKPIHRFQALPAPRGARVISPPSGEGLEGDLWVRWLTLQPKGERGQEHARKPAVVPRRTGRGARGARAIWRKLDCLKPNLQKVQMNARRKDA